MRSSGASMTSEWVYDGQVNLSEMFRLCGAERDRLIRKVVRRLPELEGLQPAEIVEDILLDVCQFAVFDEPLPVGQLALCDMGQQIVIVNSEMERFVKGKVDLQALRRTTLAHELGHVVLHQEEINQRTFRSFHHGQGGFVDTRAFQKEEEANFFAGVFLVPKASLRADRAVQNLLMAREERRQLAPSTLLKTIYRLASVLKVTPTLMKRCLIQRGWLERTKSRSTGREQLRLKWKQPYD